MVKISYEDKIKNQDLNSFNEELKTNIYEIKHLKADILQVEAKIKIQRSAIQKSYNELKSLKNRLNFYTSKVNNFEIPF